MITKNIAQLNLLDFRDHPVWTPTDDLYNEDEVSPCETCVLIALEGVYYVSARFRLTDASGFDGFIRISDGETIAIAVAINTVEFVFYSLSEQTREALGDTQTTFAKKLGKKAEEVFPLEYQTQFQFSSNTAIRGGIG